MLLFTRLLKGSNERVKRNSWAGHSTMPNEDSQRKNDRQRLKTRERGRNNALPGFLIDVQNADATENRHAPKHIWAPDQIFDKHSHRGSMTGKTITDNQNYDGSDDSGNGEPKRWLKSALNMKKLRRGDRNSRGNLDGGNVVEKLAQPVSDSGVIGLRQTVVTNGGNVRGKFDKLEDRRKKRMNASLTSDDEEINVQMSISKLRQNALRALSKENLSIKSDAQTTPISQPWISYPQNGTPRSNSHVNQYMSLVTEPNVQQDGSHGKVEKYVSLSLPKENMAGLSRSLINGDPRRQNDSRHSFNVAAMTQSAVTPRLSGNMRDVDRGSNRQGKMFSNEDRPYYASPGVGDDDGLSRYKGNNFGQKSGVQVQVKVALPSSQLPYHISEQNQHKQFPVDPQSNSRNYLPVTQKQPSLIKTVVQPVQRVVYKQYNDRLHSDGPQQYNERLHSDGPQQLHSRSNNSTPICSRKAIQKYNETDSLDELLESNKDYLYTLQCSKNKQNSTIVQQKSSPLSFVSGNNEAENNQKAFVNQENVDQGIPKNRSEEESFTSVKSVIDKLQQKVVNCNKSPSFGSPDLRYNSVPPRKGSMGLLSDTSEVRSKGSKDLEKVDSMDDLWIPRRLSDNQSAVMGSDSRGVVNCRRIPSGRPQLVDPDTRLFTGCEDRDSNAQSLRSARDGDRGPLLYTRENVKFRGKLDEAVENNLDLDSYKINLEMIGGNDEEDVEEEVSERVKKWEDIMKNRSDRMTKSDMPMKVSLVDDRRNQFPVNQSKLTTSQYPMCQPHVPAVQPQFLMNQEIPSGQSDQFSPLQQQVLFSHPKFTANQQQLASRGVNQTETTFSQPRFNESLKAASQRPIHFQEQNALNYQRRNKSLIDRKFSFGDESKSSKLSSYIVDVNNDHGNYNFDNFLYNKPQNIDQSIERVEVLRDTIVHKKTTPKPDKYNVNAFLGGGGKDLYKPGRNISSMTQNLSQSVYTYPSLSNPFNTHKQLDPNSHFSEPGTMKTTSWVPLTKSSSASLSEQQLGRSSKGNNFIVPDIKESFVADPIWKEIEKMTSYASTVAASASQLNTTPRSFSSTPLKNNITPQDPGVVSPAPKARPDIGVLSQNKVRNNQTHGYGESFNNNIAPMKDFRQANKQFDLHINASQYKSMYAQPDALDDVLNEITQEQKRRPFSPRLKTPKTGSNSSAFSVESPEQTLMSPVRHKAPRINSQYDQPLPLIIQNDLRVSAMYDNVHGGNHKTDKIIMHPRQTHSESKFMNMAPHGHEYQLDLSLLKQKLLATGLVESADDVTDSEGQSRSATLVSQDAEQMNQAIEELKELAREVETKVSQIKRKIVCTEENNNIDDILTTLRQCSTNNSSHGFSRTRKAKLSDALTELENVFKGLAFSRKSSNPNNDAWVNCGVSFAPNRGNPPLNYPHQQPVFTQPKPAPPPRFLSTNPHSSNRYDATNAFNSVQYDFMENTRKPAYQNKADELLEQLELCRQKDRTRKSPLLSTSSLSHSNTSLADPVTDDLAARRFKKVEKLKFFKPDVLSPSYMSMSPVFSPTFLPENTKRYGQAGEAVKTPDVTVDDVNYRRYKDANRADAITSPMVTSPKICYPNNRSESYLKVSRKVSQEKKAEELTGHASYGNFHKDTATVSKPPVCTQEAKEMKTVETQTSNDGSLRENNDRGAVDDQLGQRLYVRLEKNKIDRKNRRSLGYNVGKEVERVSSGEDEPGLSNSAPDLLALDLSRSEGRRDRSRRNIDTSASCNATPVMKARNQARRKLAITASDRRVKNISSSSDELQDREYSPTTNNGTTTVEYIATEKPSSYVVVLRNKYTDEEKLERTERSKSFPELLATFENAVPQNRRMSLQPHALPDRVTIAITVESFRSEPNVHDRANAPDVKTKGSVLMRECARTRLR